MHSSNICQTFAILSFAVAAASQSNRTCYDPAGNEFASDTPCSSATDKHSLCCGPGWSCLEDKMCRYTGDTQPSLNIGTLARGTCTDETFQSDECPQFCLTGDAMSNGNFIQNCNNGTGCCRIGGVDCSCAPGQPYALDFGSVNVIDSKSVSPLLEQVSSSTSSTSSASSTATTLSSANQTPTTSVAAETDKTEPNGLSAGAKIGIGVGCAFAVLGIIGGLAVFFLAKRKKRQRAEKACYMNTSQDKQSLGWAAYPELANTGMPVEKHGKSASLLYEVDGRELPRELPEGRVL